jgi:hypothetical protein
LYGDSGKDYGREDSRRSMMQDITDVFDAGEREACFSPVSPSCASVQDAPLGDQDHDRVASYTDNILDHHCPELQTSPDIGPGHQILDQKAYEVDKKNDCLADMTCPKSFGWDES